MARNIYKRSASSRRKSSRPQKWWLLGALLFIAVVAILVLEVSNTTHLFHHRQAVSGVVPSTSPKNTPASSDKSTTSSNNSPTTQNSSNQTTKNQGGTSSNELASPFGTFVSNHHPNLSNSPAPSQEQSVCQTTPGASCYLKFSNNGVTKTLTAQTADQNGQVIWNWDVNKAGFTEGSWKISAIASIDGTSKSTGDPLALEIGP